MKNHSQQRQESFFARALDKMFQVVGLPKFDEEFTKQPYWYTLHTWTMEQEKEFYDWMVNAYQKEFKCTSYQANKYVGYFLLNYGWATKNGEPQS